jgi:hypothetical protein
MKETAKALELFVDPASQARKLLEQAATSVPPQFESVKMPENVSEAKVFRQFSA